MATWLCGWLMVFQQSRFEMSVLIRHQGAGHPRPSWMTQVAVTRTLANHIALAQDHPVFRHPFPCNICVINLTAIKNK